MLAQSQETNSTEEISLTGYSAGNYYLQVYGYENALNPNYTLTIQAPGDSSGDEYEANNTLATATYLNELPEENFDDSVLTLDNESNPPSIHLAGDEDWYKLTLAATGQDGHSAEIVFDSTLGDLDLELYDATGSELIDYSNSLSDIERISLEGLAAGDYYLRVYGFDNAINPAYQLYVDAPWSLASETGDEYEANNSLRTATDLGVLDREVSLENLSIHIGSDVDWYKFTLSSQGNLTNLAGINFNHDRGDLDLSIYDDAGNLLDIAESTSDFESISLAGYTPGTYYLRVYGYGGAVNSDYNLVIDPPLDGSGDWGEDNNTAETAYNLPDVVGIKVWENLLSIHSPEDRDWFEFALDTAGTAEHEAAIAFEHILGDLDLKLYDTAGTLLESSESTEDYEFVSLEGLNAGTYRLEVFGYEGATNPEYYLGISAPGDRVGDWAEANNTQDSAYALRELQGTQSWSDLSIHVAEDEDWFSFTTSEVGTAGHAVSIDFNHEFGDLDLLVIDPEGNEYISQETANRETIALEELPSGEYLAKVYGYDGATNPDYTLTIDVPAVAEADWAEDNDTQELAYDLRDLDGSVILSNLSIDAAEDRDWFKFNLAAPPVPGQAVGIYFDRIEGNLTLELIDPAGNSHTSTTDNNSELIQLEGKGAGTYYLKVAGVNGATNSNYTLAIDSPVALVSDRAESNDTPASAYDLREIATSEADRVPTRTLNNFASNNYVDDWWFQYAIDLTEQPLGHYNYDFQYDTNYNYDSHFGTQYIDGLIESSYYTYDVAAGVANNIADGVTPYGGYNYRSSADLGLSDPSRDSLSIHSSDDVDWFTFELENEGESQPIGINFDRDLGDLQLELYEAFAPDADHNDHLVYRSNNRGDWEQIDLDGLTPGAYYLKVSGVDGATNPAYELNLGTSSRSNAYGDWTEPNDSSDTAYNLRDVDGGVYISGLAIEDDDTDWYQFTTVDAGQQGHQVRIDFNHASGDLDLVLYDSENNPIAYSDSTDDLEAISLADLAAGTYKAQVYGDDGAANPEYSLSVIAPASAIAPDILEPNNSFSTANQFSGSINASGLTIHEGDEDYSEFTTTTTGTNANFVSIEFEHDRGDLQLELYRQTETATVLVDSSTGTTDNETISLAGLAPGTYYTRVVGDSADTANTYQLYLDAPSNIEQSDQPDSQQAEDDWTVMVYMTASNLNRAAFDDINEIEYAVSQLPSTVNFSVLWDQSALGGTFTTGDNNAWSDTGRAIIQPDTNPYSIATTFELLGEQNTGESATVTDFVNWSVANAPAENYALLMWNHGSGFRGFNLDNYDFVGSADLLNTEELVTALDNVEPAIDLDIIGFEACLMGMGEVSYALRDYSDIFVASEELMLSTGVDYTTAFSVLESNPELVTPEDLVSNWIGSYQQQYQNKPGLDTLSAIDTASLDLLTSAMQNFTTVVLAGASIKDWNIMAYAPSVVARFGGANSYYHYIDLGQFMSEIAALDVNPDIASAAQEVRNAIDSSVIAKTLDARGTQGLSIYLPPRGSNIDVRYVNLHQEFFAASGWLDFLNEFIAQDSSYRSGVSTDWSESNDVAALAYDLNTLIGDGHNFAGLNSYNNDPDWFRFRIGETGLAENRVTAIYDNTNDAALSLSLYQLRGGQRELIGTSDLGSGQETVSLADLSPGEYLIKAQSSTIVPQYSLAIDAPGTVTSGEDWASSNDTADKAYSLGVIGTDRLFSGFNIAADTDDWFEFGTSRNQSDRSGTVIVDIAGSAGVNVELLNSEGVVIDSATGNDALELSYPGGAALTYQLRVNQSESEAPTSYNLIFEVQTPRDAHAESSLTSLAIDDVSELYSAGVNSLQDGRDSFLDLEEETEVFYSTANADVFSG